MRTLVVQPFGSGDAVRAILGSVRLKGQIRLKVAGERQGEEEKGHARQSPPKVTGPARRATMGTPAPYRVDALGGRQLRLAFWRNVVILSFLHKRREVRGQRSTNDVVGRGQQLRSPPTQSPCPHEAAEPRLAAGRAAGPLPFGR
jgi:hypothetical protein